jgi:hypothetical protein
VLGKAIHPIVALLTGNREKNDNRMEDKYEGRKEGDKGTRGIKQ